MVVKEEEVKEVNVSIFMPESLEDINIGSVLAFDKLQKIENLTDYERMVQLIAAMSEVDIMHVRAIPFMELENIYATYTPLFTEMSEKEYKIEDLRIIEIEGKKYGLEPDFNKMETGAFIDMGDLIQDPMANMHKIMAILFRPVVDSKQLLYTITPYSTEDDRIKEAREELFLHSMPYSVARAAVNFIATHIHS